MREFLFWLLNNVPLGRLAPHVMGLALGRKPKHVHIKHDWDVAKTIWPYEYGWGTYCARCRLILDTGLEKAEAERRCEKLRQQQENYPKGSTRLCFGR